MKAWFRVLRRFMPKSAYLAHGRLQLPDCIGIDSAGRKHVNFGESSANAYM